MTRVNARTRGHSEQKQRDKWEGIKTVQNEANEYERRAMFSGEEKGEEKTSLLIQRAVKRNERRATRKQIANSKNKTESILLSVIVTRWRVEVDDDDDGRSVVRVRLVELEAENDSNSKQHASSFPLRNMAWLEM